MARAVIAGIGIDYELIGPADGHVVALTPGGRYARDTPGLRQLADNLVAGGKRVLLWDRPNCGASDICFEGSSESDMQARALIGLIAELKLGPVALAAGSAGSRVSLIVAAKAPQAVSHLILWWISGGPLSLAQLASYYYFESAMAASHGGMAAVAQLGTWAQQIERNPANRDIILAQNPERYIDTLQRWALAFAYSESSPVPGMTPADFSALKIPALIFRSGNSDTSHTRRTSEWVHELLPQSTIVDPPWSDQEWNERLTASLAQGRGLFEGWPKLAPAILDFAS
ncbi:MAG: alpha/beta hydrolase [Hydrocarboniphaga sp.]|uniref:alpha/beta fold hydrolase n=1 Tax=Hydrocarboniphaga sp. TaxID=2033016 RepID=UPI00262566F0|nr:alpha/beta hydrolase [Hydrocarboniphaga sp.]MDB5970599.1 alpha/beta hydrolase [Hydrocarboniphaga sp.]